MSNSIPSPIAARTRAAAAIAGHVAALDEAANKLVVKGKEHADPSMGKMYESDANDILELAKLIGSGEYKAAKNKMFRMDTAARDYIPNSVYSFLMSNA